MSGFKVDIEGGASIMAKLGDVLNVAFLAVANELELGAMSIHRHAVISIQAHESVEKTVTRYQPKREQDVSAPDNPPNSDLGKLAQSVAFDIDKESLTAVVGTNLEYGKFLELGTAKMAARPWLFPAFEAHSDEVKANIADAVREAIARGA